MTNHSALIVQKLWNHCNVLRDDGVSYGDYVEQLTYLLFLKMADERKALPYASAQSIPEEYGWQSLIKRSGTELEDHYRNALKALGKEKGLLGIIFRKAQNRISDPAKLRKLIVELIDKENWTGLDADVKGDAYEGLLQKYAEDTKSGAGQYFTPRSLIRAIVDVMRPGPDELVCDPACGTGGFLLASHDFIVREHNPDKEQKRHLKHEALRGVEIVDNTARLCVMNMFLHGIGGEESPIEVTDSLASRPSKHYSMVLTNPPFGKKSSVNIVNERGEIKKESTVTVRDDFWASSSNKQLNFLQHVVSLLKADGRSAIVVPDNVLFEGGAGKDIRKALMDECDVHTLLRLPTGIFYAQGVKANVLFFDKRPAREEPWTERLWIYDLRTNMHFTLKNNQLKREDLDEFVQCFNPKNRHDRTSTYSEDNPQGRWRAFDYEELIKRDKANLDIFWIKDESLEDTDNLPPPGIIAQDITEDLQTALEQFQEIADDLGNEGEGE